jgi:hypothetical protein
MRFLSKRFVIILVLFFLVSEFILTPYFTSNKVQAEAAVGVPVADVPTEEATQEEKVLSIWQKIKKYWELYIRPALRDAAAKKLMDYITQQTLDWINNGKKPTFVGNWNQFARDAFDIAFDSVNERFRENGTDMCSPFAPQVTIYLQAYNRSNYIPPRCTIDRFKENITNSLDIVKNGGWISYQQVFMPSGNLIGLTLLAEDELFAKMEQQEKSKTNEAVSSQGFLSMKTCADAQANEKAEKTCEGKTGSEKDVCIRNQLEKTCQNWEVETPGSVAASAVDNIVKSDSMWAAGIHNFVSAVVNALVTKIFQKGLSALQSSSVNYDRDVTVDSDPSQISNFNSVKNDYLKTYEDVIYYLDSDDYPALQIWAEVKNLANTGITSCSSTDNEWQKKYEDALSIFEGIQTMVDKAREYKNEIEEIDPSTISPSELSSRLSEITSHYEDFRNNYSSILLDISRAKGTGGTTNVQQTGISEKELLETALSTAPECGSPYGGQ